MLRGPVAPPRSEAVFRGAPLGGEPIALPITSPPPPEPTYLHVVTAWRCLRHVRFLFSPRGLMSATRAGGNEGLGADALIARAAGGPRPVKKKPSLSSERRLKTPH